MVVAEFNIIASAIKWKCKGSPHQCLQNTIHICTIYAYHVIMHTVGKLVPIYSMTCFRAGGWLSPCSVHIGRNQLLN